MLIYGVRGFEGSDMFRHWIDYDLSASDRFIYYIITVTICTSDVVNLCWIDRFIMLVNIALYSDVLSNLNGAGQRVSKNPIIWKIIWWPEQWTTSQGRNNQTGSISTDERRGNDTLNCWHLWHNNSFLNIVTFRIIFCRIGLANRCIVSGNILIVVEIPSSDPPQLRQPSYSSGLCGSLSSVTGTKHFLQRTPKCWALSSALQQPYWKLSTGNVSKSRLRRWSTAYGFITHGCCGYW